MALRRKVVYLVRLHRRHHLQDGHRISKVAVVEVEILLSFQVGDALTIVHAAAADDAVHVVSFPEQ